MVESFKYHIPEDIPANERTAFHGAAAAAAKAGKKNFNFGGKTHPVTMKKDTANKIADQKEADDYHYSTGERIKKKPVKKEAMSDAEKAAHQKAIDAFKAKGGKIKKLKPGFAQGYHGKSDPGAGMKGMISPADTKQFGTKKKIGSMK